MPAAETTEESAHQGVALMPPELSITSSDGGLIQRFEGPPSDQTNQESAQTEEAVEPTHDEQIVERIREEFPEGVCVAVGYTPTQEEQEMKFGGISGSIASNRGENGRLRRGGGLVTRLKNKISRAITRANVEERLTEEEFPNERARSRRRSELRTQETRSFNRMSHDDQYAYLHAGRDHVSGNRFTNTVLALMNPDADQSLTADNVSDIAESEQRNDREFARAARAYATSQNCLGFDDEGQLAFGQFLSFSMVEDPTEKIVALNNRLNALLEEDEGHIRDLAIFTHGSSRSITFGRARETEGGAIEGRRTTGSYVAEQISGALTETVDISLFACNAANDGRRESFAHQLTDELTDDGHEATVFGHTTAAHTTRNPFGVTFHSAKEGGETSSFSNFALVASGVQAYKDAVQELADIYGTERRQEIRELIDSYSSRAIRGYRGRLLLRLFDQGDLDEAPAYTIGYDPSAVLPTLQTRLSDMWEEWWTLARARVTNDLGPAPEPAVEGSNQEVVTE